MSAIAYAASVIAIFAARYVPVLPMLFKFSAYALGSESHSLEHCILLTAQLSH